MTKLEVLQKFLEYAQEHKDNYDWVDHNTCNCGFLLKSIGQTEDMNEAAIEMVKYFQNNDIDSGGNYTNLINNIFKYDVCNVTDLKFVNVITNLLPYKFSLQELKDLENLQDKRFSTEDTKYNDIDSLINYITNWVNYEQQLVTANNKVNISVPISV